MPGQGLPFCVMLYCIICQDKVFYQHPSQPSWDICWRPGIERENPTPAQTLCARLARSLLLFGQGCAASSDGAPRPISGAHLRCRQAPVPPVPLLAARRDHPPGATAGEHFGHSGLRSPKGKGPLGALLPPSAPFGVPGPDTSRSAAPTERASCSAWVWRDCSPRCFCFETPKLHRSQPMLAAPGFQII